MPKALQLIVGFLLGLVFVSGYICLDDDTLHNPTGVHSPFCVILHVPVVAPQQDVVAESVGEPLMWGQIVPDDEQVPDTGWSTRPWRPPWVS